MRLICVHFFVQEPSASAVVGATLRNNIIMHITSANMQGNSFFMVINLSSLSFMSRFLCWKSFSCGFELSITWRKVTVNDVTQKHRRIT